VHVLCARLGLRYGLGSQGSLGACCAAFANAQVQRLEELLMVETKIRQGVQARLRALDSAAATLRPSRQQTGPKREDLELQLKAIETKIGAINRMINAAKMTRTA